MSMLTVRLDVSEGILPYGRGIVGAVAGQGHHGGRNFSYRYGVNTAVHGVP